MRLKREKIATPLLSFAGSVGWWIIDKMWGEAAYAWAQREFTSLPFSRDQIFWSITAALWLIFGWSLIAGWRRSNHTGHDHEPTPAPKPQTITNSRSGDITITMGNSGRVGNVGHKFGGGDDERQR